MAQYNGRLYIKVKDNEIWDKLSDLNISKYGIKGSIKDSVFINSNELLLDDWSIKEYDLLEFVGKIVSCIGKEGIVIADCTNLSIDANDYLIYYFGKAINTLSLTADDDGKVAELFHKTNINEVEQVLSFVNCKILTAEAEFLKEFNIKYKNIKKYRIIDDASKFVIDKTTLKKLKRLTEAEEIVIPEGVTEIETLNATGVEKVVLPWTLQVIKEEAFKNKKYLKDINLPNGLLKIGTAAFNKCKSLETIVIPETVTSIGSRAFSQTGLRSVYIPDSVKTIGAGAFLCPKLEKISLPIKFKDKFEKICNSSCLLDSGIEFRD